MHQTIERLKRLSTVMADNNKVKIWIQLADAENPIALSISPEDEENYRKAEELVNTL